MPVKFLSDCFPSEMTILLLVQGWIHPKCDDQLQMTSEDDVWVDWRPGLD